MCLSAKDSDHGHWSLNMALLMTKRRDVSHTLNNWVDAVVPHDIVQARCSCLRPLHMFVLTKATYIL